MRNFVLCAAALLAAGAAKAADQKQLTLTIYNNNLALVQDIRRLDVAAGRSRLEFKDVSASIKPETVALSGRGLSVVEQNFDYDLLTPAKMMEKAVGKQIQIIRTNPGTGGQTTETATVLSVNEGVVLRVGNRIEVLRDDGIPTRVIFSSIPENLRAEPTLSVTVDAAGGGERETTLSYLTAGLSWKADYVALFDERQSALNLQGWITLNNTSGTSFKDAKAELVAGDINISDSYQQNNYQYRSATSSGGSGAANAEAIADYKLYALPERVTVAQNQTKQVGFIDLHAVKAERAYKYETSEFASNSNFEHVDSVLKFRNAGAALPSGTIRVYMRDVEGEPKFVGENTLDHTPADSDLAIKLGEAFDITVQRTLVSSQKISDWNTKYSMSYVLHNAGPAPVTVDLHQGGMWRDGKVKGESIPSRRIDAYTLGWYVPIAANGDTTLTFTVDTGD
jgi:hypothetical protein